MRRWLRLLPPLCIVALGVVLYMAGAPRGVIALVCALPLAPLLYIHAREILDARARRAGKRSMFEDWTLLAVGVFFCGAALLTMGSDWRTGTVMLAFFGGCTLMFVVIIQRRLRERGFRALRVSVEGGRNIEADKTYLFSLSAGILVVGAVIFIVGTTIPPLVRGIGAFMALCGVFLLAAWASGLLRQYLRFEPEGLVFGLRRFEYRVPWDSIAGVRTMEVANNAMVFLVVPDITQISVAPPGARGKFVRHLKRKGLCIAPAVFGMDTPPLLAALERYVREPQARAELAPRPDAAGLQPLPHARLR